MRYDDFRRVVREKGRELYRDMPWRRDTRAYSVLVSELMLQQTQVVRVVPKFEHFMKLFPNQQALADAPLAEVLVAWQGLGYNRRAGYLHQTAKQLVANGTLPETIKELLHLPGVGRNTAGAVMAYAFNKPALFIETNIRTVYLHHFFVGEERVSDARIIEKLSATIDHTNPREFYWALMDYGRWLKLHVPSNIHRSKHYKKQPKLAGSLREMRGVIIKRLARKSPLADLALDNRYSVAVEGLLADGLIEPYKTTYRLTK